LTLVLLGHAGKSDGWKAVGRERLPGAGQWRSDRIVCLLWDRPEPVKALAEVAPKTLSSTESLRSARRLASAKHFESPFPMLVVALDALRHGLARKVFNLREHGGQRRRVHRGLVGGDRVRRHSGVLESGTE
jgi:hypothetical protein